ncbi:hypothetical protein [Kribbella sp. CA-247076]|uniref:hypothetical protein n=1 Tax=Kribbella sp. CA-247076 TaxID=3239941 RepID=UPI003D943588
MRIDLLSGPRWISAVVIGVLYGALFVLFVRFLGDESWRGALVAGAISGPVFGVLFTFIMAKRRREVQAMVGDVPPEQLASIERAARRGPLPSDPELRQAAANVARHQVNHYRRQRWWFIVAAVLLLGSAVTQLIDQRYAGGTISLAAALVLAFVPWDQKRLRRRADELSRPPVS